MKEATAPTIASASTPAAPKRLDFFERYLTVWVFVCMLVGVALGKLLPGAVAALSTLEFGEGSQVNVPIAVLIWLMIYPMMLRLISVRSAASRSGRRDCLLPYSSTGW